MSRFLSWAADPLPGIPVSEPVGDGGQGFGFSQRPLRGDKLTGVRIAGEPLNNNVIRYPLQKIAHQIHIFVLVEALVAAAPVPIMQRCSSDHIQQVKFEAVDADIRQKIGCFKHVRAIFTWQPQDNVGADFDAPALGGRYGSSKARYVMPSIDGNQRFIVGGLQSVLYPNQGMFCIFLQ